MWPVMVWARVGRAGVVWMRVWVVMWPWVGWIWAVSRWVRAWRAGVLRFSRAMWWPGWMARSRRGRWGWDTSCRCTRGPMVAGADVVWCRRVRSESLTGVRSCGWCSPGWDCSGWCGVRMVFVCRVVFTA